MSKGNGVSGFDLSDLATVDTIEHVVLSPRDGQPVMSYGEPWTITLAGPTHPATLRAEQGRYRRMVELGTVYGDNPLPPEVAHEVVRRAVAARMIAWTPIDLAGEMRLECTPDNAERVLQKAGWLYHDIHFALERRTAFLAPSPGASVSTLGTSSGSTARTKKGSQSRPTGASVRGDKARLARSSAPS